MSEDLARHHQLVMGTVVSYRLEAGGLAQGVLLAALEEAMAELHRLDELFSTFKAESPMSRLRRGELLPAEAPPEIGVVLALCHEVRDRTKGCFDPWTLPGGVDPTGLVKGWAVERAAGLLGAAGVQAGVVNGGGDIQTLGSPPDGPVWRLGIQHPWRREALAGVVELRAGQALATSGCYERGDHLLARRGAEGSWPRPPSLASVSVAGPSLALADGMATGLFAAGPDVLSLAAELGEGYEAYVIFGDGSEAATAGFPFASPPTAASSGDSHVSQPA